jgi:hypothetical protein
LALFLQRVTFVFNSLQPLFAKYPGWGIPLQTSLLESAISRLFLPRLFANQLLLSAAMRVVPILLPLCFHNDTNSFSRKPFILITIRIAGGCGYLSGLGAQLG